MRCWVLAEEQLLGFSMHRYRNGEHKYVILLRTRAISLRPKYLMIELTHQNISQINCSDNNKCICWFGGRAVLSIILGFLLSHFPMYFKQIYRQQFDSHYKCEAGVRLQTRQRKQCAAFVQIIRSSGIMKVCYHLTFGAEVGFAF
ncbi:Hypothetical_protein [Hexamita inflata]|uniref:Hypothetical_protein n=1 Tax=Hexamita inflata TaxID=28002 RepID=A0ABP1GJA1_9EUKA